MILPEAITAEWIAVFIAALALAISLITLHRDTRSREFERMNQLHQRLGHINSEIMKLPEEAKGKQKKKLAHDLEFLIEEKLNVYDYMCFLLNYRQLNESIMYDHAHKDFFRFFNDNKRQLRKSDYPDIYEVEFRWRKYPPTTICGRWMSWVRKVLKMRA